MVPDAEMVQKDQKKMIAKVAKDAEKAATKAVKEAEKAQLKAVADATKAEGKSRIALEKTEEAARKKCEKAEEVASRKSVAKELKATAASKAAIDHPLEGTRKRARTTGMSLQPNGPGPSKRMQVGECRIETEEHIAVTPSVTISNPPPQLDTTVASPPTPKARPKPQPQGWPKLQTTQIDPQLANIGREIADARDFDASISMLSLPALTDLFIWNCPVT